MPDFDVEWYANGGIINRPSLIGAGEAGPEAVVPLSASRLKPLTDAIAEADARNNEKLLNGMYQVFSMALREANFSVTIGRRDFERSLREAGAL
jgi:SLT domain-containing protein